MRSISRRSERITSRSRSGEDSSASRTSSQASTATSWLGAALYLVAYPILTCCLSYFLFKFGYRSGLEGMQNIMATGQLDKLTNTMTVMGLIVVGALTASFVSVSLPIQITKDVYDATTGTVLENQVLFNADNMLNTIFPKILPLGLTMGVYYLYSKKRWSPMKLMGLILVMAGVLTGIGYLCGVYV